MSRIQLDKRLGELERRAPRPETDHTMTQVDQWCEAALGCTFDDLETGDLDRIEQLLRDAPDFAYPSILRACIARPEDREPERPKIPKDWPWTRGAQGQLYQTCPDTPEWRAYAAWQERHRWWYPSREDHPEAIALAQWVEAWAVSPDRVYLYGVDLRFVFSRIGIMPWPHMKYCELRRLADLCAALDELAAEHPDIELPLTAWWTVLDWVEGDIRRSMRVAG